MKMKELDLSTPTIGQPWPEQGGIYIGSRLIEGQVHHVVIPGGPEHDLKEVQFSKVESAVSGLGEINGHNDWRAPDQEDLMLAYVNVPDQFVRTGGLDSVYWSRSEHHGWTWAVDFKSGYVISAGRIDEFRVRPVRRFVLEQL